MTLRKITVSGYKSIEHAEVELRALNVLIGANGAGKSNFIGVFELLREVVEGRLASYVLRRGGADRLLRFGRKRTRSIGIDLALDAYGYQVILAPSDENELFVDLEVCRFADADQGGSKTLPIARGSTRESELRKVAERAPGDIADQVYRGVSEWRVYHFHDTSAEARIKQVGDIGDNEVLRPDASNLAAFLHRLEKTAPSSYGLIVHMVQRVAPFFDRFKLRPMPENEHSIVLKWLERGSDVEFNAHALSDGTLRFICLATLLLQPELPSVILLDEPELGLHPLAITLLAEFLQRASLHTQVIVSTQSVRLVDEFEPTDLLVVDRERSSGASVFHRPTVEEVRSWLDGYSLGELWEKNIVGGYPG